MTQALRHKIRVLCLHGYRTNAKVMEAQTQVLRQALGDAAKFEFLNAPFEADGPTDPVIEKLFGGTAPFREWFRVPIIGKRDVGPGSDSELNTAAEVAKVRGAMDQENDWYLEYEGIEEAIAIVGETVSKRGPFDVVVGFSQGAILLTLLSALYLHRHNVRLWKLAICVGGMPVMDPQFRSLFENPETGERIQVPFSSVHIYGESDPIHLESKKLAKLYEDYPHAAAHGKRRIVYEHTGGHKFPSLKGNEAFYEKLVQVIHDHSNTEPTVKREASEGTTSKL
ncbi:Serine hydrolase [Globisporangium polare]